jgi:SAM-dependent methyltransferase
VTRTGLYFVVTVSLALTLTMLGRAHTAEAEKPERPGPVPDVVYIPTPHDVVAKMLDLAKTRRDDVVYDLGCGDGRIVVAAARRYGCRAVGVDIDPRRVEEARAKVAAARLEKLVRIRQEELFDVNLAPATVVTLYLSPKYNTRLLPQLDTLKPGSRIVSHQFEIRGVKPERIVQFDSRDDGRRHTLYLWTTPLERRE